MVTDASTHEPPGGLTAQDLERLALLPAEPPGQRIDHAIAMAREVLGMDLGYVTEFVGSEQIYRAVSGDGASFEVAAGDGNPLDGSYCERMIAGTIPTIVPNTAENAELRDLAATRIGSVGAYVGVPIVLSDGSLYGSMCAVSHKAQTALGERHLRIIEMLSKIVASGIEQERLERENDRLRTQIIDISDQLDEAEEDRRVSKIMLSGEFTKVSPPADGG
jgi:GAF domain-containing protein